MARNVILTGGHSHTFPVATPALAALLAEHGIDSFISDDIEGALAGLDATRPELVTVYALRWSMTQGEKYAPYRARWAFSLSERGRAAILSHLDRGGGLLALHTAVICFDDWPEWPRILGGAWIWGQSGHPPYGGVEVRLEERDHALLSGLQDFAIDDEVYGDLKLAPDLRPLMQARSDAAQRWHPVLWTREAGNARVAVDMLGHDAGAFSHPVHRRIVARAALWALGRGKGEIAAA